MSQADAPVIVHKHDAAGREVWSWTAARRRLTPTSAVVEARFSAGPFEIHGLSLRPGDRFVESYYTDRWYNVFAVYDGETGRLKGWYCNISRPARLEDGHVRWEDLALDLIVLPGGEQFVLDEDEFGALELSAVDRSQALATLEALRDLARRRAAPFAERETTSEVGR